MAIATLPMLGGKVYAIWSPIMAQAALRNRNMTFEVFLIEFTQYIFGLTDESKHALREGGAVAEILRQTPSSMAGQNLYRMNLRALVYVAERINAIGEDGLAIENVYLWLRDMMTMATAEALYGRRENPLAKDASLMDTFW